MRRPTRRGRNSPAVSEAPRGRTAEGSGAVLSTHNLAVGYAGVPVVRGLDIEIRSGEVVSLLGRNGAGKTTLMHTLAGVIAPVSGQIMINGVRPPAAFHARVRAGLGLVTEERSIIRRLSVLDNLRLGRGPVDAALARFPELVPLRQRRAGLLSGGEQQMLALAKLLAAQPSVLLIDELSLGLAPLIVDRLLTEVRRAATEDGTSVLLVEQQPATALRVADRAYVIAGGEVKLTGPAPELLGRRSEIEALYLES